MTKISIIAAVAKSGAIGNKNELIYWLPNDLKRFKSLTSGNTIIMGSNTFRSLPKGALPNRRNIVLSKKNSFFPGAETFPSLVEALANCDNEENIFIIGGAMLYKTALEIADCLMLTEVENEPNEADAFFPQVNNEEWYVAEKESHTADEKHQFNYTFVTYKRKP